MGDVVLDTLPLLFAANVDVLDRHEDLPEVQRVLRALLRRSVGLVLQLLPLLLLLVQLAPHLVHLVSHLDLLPLLLLPISVVLAPEIFDLFVGLRLKLHQVLVGTLQRLIPGHQILDFGIVVSIGLLHLLEELLVLLVPVYVLLQALAFPFVLLQLLLQLVDLLVLLLDLGGLLGRARLGPAPLRLVVLEELVEAEELVLQL
mmetsp:Transcript_28438/g.74354  ORF Transcript_28438/g.74354 Transcript_28438/m.74354 type:complete len:202 (-) Transcript_28438:263-868(-)